MTTKLFVLPDHEPANRKPCPPCRCTAFKCGGERPHCKACAYTGKAELCEEMRNSHRDNILDEMVCADRATIVALGEAATDIMNRVPVELEVQRWDRIHTTSPKQSIHAVKRFIESVSFIRWKKKHGSSVNLEVLQTKPFGKWETVWQKKYYGTMGTAGISVKAMGSKEWELSFEGPLAVWMLRSKKNDPVYL